VQIFTRRSESSFTRALILNNVGLLLVLGVVLLAIMAWHGVITAQEANRQQMQEMLRHATARLQRHIHEAEQAAASIERVMRTSQVTAERLQATMENLQAAFEQHPELSYMGIVLPQHGEYGNLERTDDGKVLLWLFPGDRPADRTVRNFLLRPEGFQPHQAFPADGYDPRTRPFFQAGLDGPASGTWMPAYPWIVHTDPAAALWGFSYVKAVRDPSGALLGVLDTDLDMPALNRFLQTLSSEYKCEISVVELGTELRLVGGPGIRAVPRTLPPEFQSIVEGAQGGTTVEVLTLDERRRWAATQRITLTGGVPWLVVVSREAPFMDAAVLRQLLEVVGMGLAIALGLILLSLRTAARFGRPLAELADHVAQIGQRDGRGLESRKLNFVGSFHETRRLGEALDQMLAERQQSEEHLLRLAMYDELTGLASRTMVQNSIASAIFHARHHQGLVGLLYLDLDRFKIINDGYGHQFGDAVLQAIAARLSGLIRASDMAARLAGDEFLILLPNLAHASDAELIARKLVRALDCPLAVEGRDLQISGSIGVSLFPQDGETVETLIDHADMAMYRAKEMGRNNWQFFTSGIGQESQRRTELEIQLRGAVSAGQLYLVYQSKVERKERRISGCEVLLRWTHPVLGDVPPSQFIPVAEESGLIVLIGDWVLRAACQQARTWMDEGHPISVAVNISARQFLQQDMVHWVTQTLQQTGLPPSLLELELTESLLVQDVEKITVCLRELKALGVRLSIDDFGTGYSSLNYLKNFAVDALKIDRSFVQNMLTQNEDQAIVQAIISLAHSLGFKVVAEGVETEEHYRFLAEQACDEMQGYHFSRPVPAAEFQRLLRGQVPQAHTN